MELLRLYGGATPDAMVQVATGLSDCCATAQQHGTSLPELVAPFEQPVLVGQPRRPFYLQLKLPEVERFYLDVPKKVLVRGGFFIRWAFGCPEKSRVAVARDQDGPAIRYWGEVRADTLPDGEYWIARRNACPDAPLYMATEWNLKEGARLYEFGEVWAVPAEEVRAVIVHDWRTMRLWR